MDAELLFVIGTILGVILVLIYNKVTTGKWYLTKEQINDVEELVKGIFALFTKSQPISNTPLWVLDEVPKESYTISDEYLNLVLDTCVDELERREVRETILAKESYSADPAEYTLHTTGKGGGKWVIDVGRPILVEPITLSYKYLSQTKLAEIISLNPSDTFNIMYQIKECEKECWKTYTITVGDYYVTVKDGDYSASRREGPDTPLTETN